MGGGAIIIPPLLAPPPPNHHHHPHNHHQHLELDERDVVWPHTCHSLSPTSPSPSSHYSNSPSPSPLPSPRPDKLGLGLGLSAVLSTDPLPLICKRTPAAVAVPPLRSHDRSFVSVAGRPMQMSAPVNVPVWPGRRRQEAEAAAVEEEGKGMRDVEEKPLEEDEDDYDDVGRMVPPHLLAARSRAISFSVFEGVGRTLKGRDLRQVRNAVLQKTGFLD